MKRWVINWVVSPVCIATAVLLVAWVLSIPVTFGTVVLCVTCALASDLADLVFEGRPIEGPRRWE